MASGHEPITTKVTFNKEIIRILTRRCLECHRAGGFAPMPLATYGEARPWAKAIKEEVLERRMPPWNAAKGAGDFSNDRSLTPLEIELLVDWVEGGAPKGDDKDLPAPDSSGPGLGPPDLVAPGPPPKQNRWIRAWEFHPSDSSVKQAEFWIGSTYLGSWAPPEGASVFPEGVGQLLPAGSPITIKGGPGELRLYFAAQPPPYQLRHMRLSCGSRPLRQAIRLEAIRPYSPVEITARHLDGRFDVLGLFRKSTLNFPYLPTYRYRRPVDLPAGSRLVLHSPESTCGTMVSYAAPRTSPGPGF